MNLTLPDGRAVQLGERTAGGSKNETRFGYLSDGGPVVVKLQANYGALGNEETALRFLAATSVRVPGVVGSGATDDGRQFLVITREPGVRTVTPEGWGRFGRDLAALASVDVDSCPLPLVTAEAFAEAHRGHLAAVAHIVGDDVEAVATAIDAVEGTQRRAFTHGDPGSGNYLDTGDVGVLLDWETASVSPFGLDAGRAVFIALMDLGKSGRPAELVDAFLAGYLAALPASVQLSPELLRAWTVIAGLQFIHGRFVHPLQADRTPEVAAAVLAGYLHAAG